MLYVSSFKVNGTVIKLVLQSKKNLQQFIGNLTFIMGNSLYEFHWNALNKDSYLM